MQTSSATYFADIKPDPRLRVVVLGSGVLLALTALLLIVSLPIEPLWAGCCIVAWLLLSGTELLLLQQGYRRARRYRLDIDGSIVIYRRDGGRDIGRYAVGSVVLANWAWLRIVAGDGSSWAEPLRGSVRESQQWRRFQVICRHLAAC